MGPIEHLLRSPTECTIFVLLLQDQFYVMVPSGLTHVIIRLLQTYQSIGPTLGTDKSGVNLHYLIFHPTRFLFEYSVNSMVFTFSHN